MSEDKLVDIYIITAGGKPLYFSHERDVSDSDVLFSGMITAIMDFLREVKVGEAKNFNTDTRTITIFSEIKFAYVFITNKISEINDEAVAKLHNKLSLSVGPIIYSFTDSLEDSLDSKLPGMIEIAVDNVYKQWDTDMRESKATRRAKDSLW